LLQNRRSSQSLNILFYVFDLLHLDGRDLKNVPLVQRRELLEALMAKSTGPLRISAAMQGPASQIWKEVTRLGLEGVIAKQKNSLYESGRRSGAWIKVKTQAEQEFVIGGCTPPEGTRKYFGAILVGYYQGRDLIFASRVGTGFDHATLKSLHALFLQHRTATCPFSNLPTQRAGRFGQGVTAAEMSRCTWLKPKLVGQVRFQEWTADGSLRQPVFLGLRTDKAPEEVVRESRP
jgi:bifunctional non-homologous end joining protein LigD